MLRVPDASSSSKAQNTPISSVCALVILLVAAVWLKTSIWLESPPCSRQRVDNRRHGPQTWALHSSACRIHSRCATAGGGNFGKGELALPDATGFCRGTG
eukprot:247603-Amphidinium_carterae.1